MNLSNISEKNKYWISAGCLFFVIYSTLYIVRPICTFLRGFSYFPLSMNLMMVVFLSLTIYYFVSKDSIKLKSTYCLLFLVIGFYIYNIIQIKSPEEKLHFIEYGILAFLVYKALLFDFSMWPSLGLAFLITSICGWGDEGIQHILPNRVYQIEDVRLNSMSGLLVLCLAYVFEREKKYHD